MGLLLLLLLLFLPLPLLPSLSLLAPAPPAVPPPPPPPPPLVSIPNLFFFLLTSLGSETATTFLGLTGAPLKALLPSTIFPPPRTWQYTPDPPRSSGCWLTSE